MDKGKKGREREGGSEGKEKKGEGGKGKGRGRKGAGRRYSPFHSLFVSGATVRCKRRFDILNSSAWLTSVSGGQTEIVFSNSALNSPLDKNSATG